MCVRFATQQRDTSGLINHQVKYFAKANTGSPEVLLVKFLYKQQYVCEVASKSQNIYHIVQNKYCFALIPLFIFLSWSISGLFYCVFSASSLAIMAAWELLS